MEWLDRPLGHLGLLPARLARRVQLPMLVLEPADECGADTPEAAAELCRVFVTFIQIVVGLVAPLAIMAAVQAPVHAAAADAAARRELQRRRRQARQGRLSPPSDDGSDGMAKWPQLQACCSAARGLYNEADAVLQHLGELLGSTQHGVVLSAAAWWLTASLCWVLALLLQ